MPNSKIDSIKNQVLQLIQEGKTNKDIVSFIMYTCGVADRTAERWLRKNSVVSNSSQELKVKAKDVTSLEELIDVCKVDTNKYKIDKFNVKKNNIKDKEGELVARYDVDAYLSPKSPFDNDELLNRFIEDANKHSPKSFIFNYTDLGTDKLLEIDAPDAHLAKLGWGVEVGDDYDIKIACKLFKEAVFDLVNKSQGGFNRILFPIGNDYFHFDDSKSHTTAGTQVDADSRWQKMFLEGCSLLSDIIEKLAQLAPIDVLVVRGNHDERASFYLGEYLKAWFRNHPGVKIDNSPTPRKYYVYGKNLLGFTHGEDNKAETLPLIMASEQKENWGKTKHKYWALGHLHHQILKEYNGVKVRVVPSLSGTDSWHHAKGFIGNDRGATASLFDKENGMEATFYHIVKK